MFYVCSLLEERIIPACAPTFRRSAFDRYLRTGRSNDTSLELKYNHNHDSATGRFTSAEGADVVPQDREGVERVSLGAFEKAAARLAYSANANLRKNITSAFEKVARRPFTDEKMKTILGDVLNGRSTTKDGLKLFSTFNPRTARFNAAQVNIIGTYVRELPSSPLYSSVRHGWWSYLKSIRGSR